MASQPNQGELSLPFSIDGCSNISTSDSLKSLLNAFMANAPPGLELASPPTKEVVSQALASPNLLHYANEAQQPTTDMVQQDDSYSLSTIINNLVENQSTSHYQPSSLNDSLQGNGQSPSESVYPQLSNRKY